MVQTVFINSFAVLALFIAQSATSLEIVSREEWKAAPPKSIRYINDSVPFVIIHHSYQPPACFTDEDCIVAMQNIQKFHQVDRGWDDFGYNFAIGGNGKIYEGRGFDRVGAHALEYNPKSIGICLIGDWQKELPPKIMLQAAQDLITYSVEQGHLSKNYTLLGHNQVRSTDCPGPALFNEIKTWTNFGQTPVKTSAQNEIRNVD